MSIDLARWLSDEEQVAYNALARLRPVVTEAAAEIQSALVDLETIAALREGLAAEGRLP